MLINLVQNAAESVSTRMITLRARRDTRQLQGHPSEVVVIEVEDTAAFSPKYANGSLTPSSVRKLAGPGLGLPISARIIETHGGQIGVQTQRCRARHSPLSCRRATKEHEAEDFLSLKTMRRWPHPLRHVLQTEGYEVETAANAEEAWPKSMERDLMSWSPTAVQVRAD